MKHEPVLKLVLIIGVLHEKTIEVVQGVVLCPGAEEAVYIVRVPDRSVHDHLSRMEGPHGSAVESVIEVPDLPLSTVLICEGGSQGKRKPFGLPNDRYVIIRLRKMLAPPVNLPGGGLDGRAVYPGTFAEGQCP